MARNVLVINRDLGETRVALIENGVVVELQIERAGARSTVGNVVLGRVTRVLPGMQAAFIDVGMERAAFLHVEDLIRPDDFEAYLAGDSRHIEAGGRADYGQEEADSSAHVSTPEPAEADEEQVAGDAEPDEPLAEEDDPGPSPGPAAEDLATHEATADDRVADDDDEPLIGSAGDELEPAEPPGEQQAFAFERPDGLPPDTEIGPSEPLDASPEGSESLRHVPAHEPNEDPRGRSRRRRRRRGKKGEPPEPAPKRATAERKPAARATASRDRRIKPSQGRVARSVPITEVVKEGDEVIVQISKEPIGTKGARVTSHISLPGRYVVYLPTVEHVGISKRIGSARERGRLREVMESLKPETGGLIVRTVAEGLTKKSLKADVGYLIKVWREVSRRREGSKAPTVLYTELDLVARTARDLFTDEIEKIVIDDKEEYARLVRFVEMFMPNRVKDIELYGGDDPIFDAYGIEDEIGRALSRKVPLPSGGYLILDQAEALTAIDVNTGRFVGKGSKDLEETALKTNLEAVEEIAYQLRFRNIGGLVILDLIDMESSANRERVWRELERALARDKAKTTINRISELGLIEMTRKRVRESLSRTMHEPCFYCDGTGQIMSRTTIAHEILRQIRRERQSLPGYCVVVNAHPAIVDVMLGEAKERVEEAERRYQRRIEFNPRREYHIEQFDLQGK
jgi:ribonuclease G